MSENGCCCCCCAILVVILGLAIAGLTAFLCIKFIGPSSSDSDGQVASMNASTPISTNSTMSTTITTLTTMLTTSTTLTASTMSTNSTVSTVKPLTTPSGQGDCSRRNSSCSECIGNVKCYYCHKDKSCRLYPDWAVLPTSECPLSQVRWGATCAIGFEVLVIAAAVVVAVVGVLVLSLCCYYTHCCRCCFCCRKARCGGSGCHTWRDFKWSRDNRSNQMNPNNWRYWKARGVE
ncbi:PTTG1IP [Branchiostoma lanceolatum]|uniref:PTTG1IP protein n=1 Tax=Branchiostoma lanceolatum TaxID=7740 RepID=A0A8K0ERF5_BRALA|nr:PTTG1IP [Branchiostoma lanceolatum]